MSVPQGFEIAVAIVGSYLHASVCFGAQAMLMFYGYACLEESSRLFPAQDWGIVRAGSGEKRNCISAAGCPPGDFTPGLLLAANVRKMQFLISLCCCGAVVSIIM